MEKSSNYRTLRQSYSIHKGRHLAKPVLIVAPDGYILAIQGPSFADGSNNDAALLRNELLKSQSDMKQWFAIGDIFLLDRGYRDVIPFLEERQYVAKMPPCAVRGQR